jgi:outer membrane protein OmpA-like peptidoglycan-associated protein
MEKNIMNKQFIALSILLLIAPACAKRKNATVVVPTYVTPENPGLITHQVPVIQDVPESNLVPEVSEINPEINEDVDAFILEEDENPFNADLIRTTSSSNEADVTTINDEGDLISVNEDEEQVGDLQNDSAKYGLKRIYYDFDQYDTRPDQQAAIDHNLNKVKDLVDKDFTVVVEGHACNSAGSSAYNMMLSEKRAQKLAEHFTDNGVDEAKLRTVGRGNELPIVSSGNREQQAPNRRVEIYAYKS